tara:strand:- start:1199 stop:1357 length:159 start_codon:yes stop_codon:yes gene_type:complete
MDLDQEIIITCGIHGDFKMTAADHMGDNPERIAYGCPNCNADIKLEDQENDI